MKKTLSFLCVLALLVTMTLPLFGSVAVSAETRARKTLYQEILERDGFIEGVWYPWFTHTYLGCGFSANEVAAKYVTNRWYDFNIVGIDAYGAHKIYAEIYNLKAMGYNMLAIAGSPYGEGVKYDAYGDVLGIKQDYLTNVRRFLDICRDVGMPVMWNICFHSSSMPDYYGMDAWNILCRFYADEKVADHYAQRFVKPLCQLLNDYDDVVALIALTDEAENEINDSNVPNANDSKAYGTTKEKMLYFINAMNDVVAQEVPQIARTIAANSDDLGLYCDVELDVLGRNRYSDEGTVPGISNMYPTVPMLLTEYNLATASGMNETQYSKIQLKFRDEMKRVGYQGGFQWCWQPNAKGGAMDLLMSGGSVTDFRKSMYDRYYYTIDAISAHQGKAVVLDTPSLFYYSGNGLLEWVPSRQAATVTIQSSTDNGKTWRTVANAIDQDSLIKNNKCVYQARDAATLAIYRVTVSDGKGHTASAVTNRPGVAVDYIGTSNNSSVSPVSRPKVVKASVDFDSTSALVLTSFGLNLNRPQTAGSNAIKNGSFEQEGGQWNNRTFLSNAVQVVEDPTAPDGSKSLHFDTRTTALPGWHTFTVTVTPNTDYVLSAWVKGAYIAKDNNFYASFGVLNPATGTFATYPQFSGRRSRQDGQIYPTAWDEEWHLRSVSFNSGKHSEVVIGLYGCGSEMWLDDIALFKMGYGMTYLSDTAKGVVGFSYNYEYMRCAPDKSLTENLRFDDAKSTYWQSGSGWDNGFLSIVNSDKNYGKSLKYTASAKPAGISYIKWIPVKKHTDYVVTFNYKVLKEGDGYIRLATRRGEGISPFVTVDFLGSSLYEGEDGWCTFSTMIDTSAFDKIALVITDLGGEVLIDNFRVFLPEDGSDVSDLPGGQGGATQPPVVRPTTTASTARPSTTTFTKPVGPTESVTRPTESTTLPTSVADTDPTATQSVTSVPVGDTTATTVATAAPDEEEPADGTPQRPLNPLVLWVSVVVAALVLAAGGVTALLLLRKKKKE